MLQHDLTNTSTSAGAPNSDLHLLGFKPIAIDQSLIDDGISWLGKNKEPPWQFRQLTLTNRGEPFFLLSDCDCPFELS